MRQARSGLAGLIQLRVVNHHTAKEGPTIFSANLFQAYQSVRTGQFIEAVRERHGGTAAEIVSSVCRLGFTTISELRDRFLRDGNHAQNEDPKKIKRIVQILIDEHFLIMQRKTHFHEGHDAKKDIELSLMSPAALARLTGTKAKLEHNEAIETRYKQAVDTGFAEYGHINTKLASHLGSEYVNGNGDITTNGHSQGLSTLVQPNYHKVVTLSQIASAQAFISRTHNKTTSTIFSCVIQQVAPPDIWSDEGSDFSHQLDLQHLQQSVASELRQHRSTDLANGTPRTNGHRPDDRQDEDEIRIGDIEREMQLLMEGSLKFISHTGSSWVIDKSSMVTWVKEREVLRVMDSRLDPPAPRVLRILIDKGMLEEKTLQEVALLGAKELRQSLSKLKQMGYLDLQEIPRDPHRLPNKTVFLWKHNTNRVAKLIVENVYTGILRLLQMLKLERKGLSGTLEKVERDDVKGKEQEMLAPGEFTVLVRFRRLEQWVWGEIQRLDSTVAILRDC